MDYKNKRVCKKCFELKNLEDFKNVKNKDKVYYRYICLKCYNENRTKYNKKYYDNNKEVLLNNAKSKRKKL